MESQTPKDACLPEAPMALPSSQSEGTPLLVGVKAAKANLVPGLYLQLLMLAVVFAYYRVGWARPWFDRLGEWKQTSGHLFTVIAAVMAGALLPELFKLCYLQRRWPVRHDAGDTLFAAGFYAANSLCVECLYRGQAMWFGTDNTFPVLAKKIAVDQFIYNPVFAAPFAVIAFAWKNSGYSFAVVGELLSIRAYVGQILPTLIATWLVWIPAVAVIYCLPPLLQIPIFSLALCFWALMLAYIHSQPERLPDIRSTP